MEEAAALTVLWVLRLTGRSICRPPSFPAAGRLLCGSQISCLMFEE